MLSEKELDQKGKVKCETNGVTYVTGFKIEPGAIRKMGLVHILTKRNRELLNRAKPQVFQGRCKNTHSLSQRWTFCSGQSLQAVLISQASFLLLAPVKILSKGLKQASPSLKTLAGLLGFLPE